MLADREHQSIVHRPAARAELQLGQICHQGHDREVGQIYPAILEAEISELPGEHRGAFQITQLETHAKFYIQRVEVLGLEVA